MAQNSGFFDALESGGVYDRTYSSADYCDNLATIIKNGVRYSSNDDLKVSSGNGMALNVNIGRAWINGHWFYNDTVYTGLTLATAPTGNQSRIDRVVVRLNTSVGTRSCSLMIITGTAAATPIAPALSRTDSLYDICLAEITVAAGTTAITDEMITDKRADGTLCGWASSVTPAIMSMLRQYVWAETLASATSTVTFDISQYDPDDVCILDVYTNGILERAGVDYTLSGSTITFTEQKSAGTEITVVLYKSIDGTGLESVADQVEELQATVDKLVSMEEYVYECNGINDNVNISTLAQNWLNGQGTNDYSILKITVVGQNIGIAAANSGAGTSVNPYKWFDLGLSQTKNRKVIIDFTNAGVIKPPIAQGTYNVIFAGQDAHVIGAVVWAWQSNGATQVLFFNGLGNVSAEDCLFRSFTNSTSYIAQNGRFKNCQALITCKQQTSYCFAPAAGEVIVVEGGMYKCYTGLSTGYSAIFAVWYSNAAIIADKVVCPKNAQTGYYQTYLATAPSGYCNLNNIIGTLVNNTNGTVNETNRISIDLATNL